MPRATINDVARLAGVSIKTVSRVLNREPNVRDATRSRVDAAIRSLKYRPNLSARNLAGSRSHVIGLVYEDPGTYEMPSSGYMLTVQQGVLEACREDNYDLLIQPLNLHGDQVADEMREMIGHAKPYGIVLAAPLSNIPELVRVIEETGTPLARVSPGEGKPMPCTVATNDREISAEMTRYLAGLGHRRIGFITGSPDHKAVTRRFLGYQDGLRESNLPLSRARIAEGDNSTGSGERAARSLLKGRYPPTAIFAANDDMAAGVMRVAHEIGIRIPEQLSVAGFDDIALAQQVYPALTTIRQPLAEMARHATRALIEGRRTGFPPRDVEVLPASLKIRDSTGPAPQ